MSSCPHVLMYHLLAFDSHHLILGYANGTIEIIDILSSHSRPFHEIQASLILQQQQQQDFTQTLLKVQRRTSTIAPTTLPQ